ncbi:LeuA family protein [Desulfonatronum sp. SC1]|uniref:LeuA family protein n=1 Tax=Desulfonatronum sp. SC1 TaxID=2109626 RepID=UPI000D2FB3C1|nr:LeuA family protein [Desulfonatronum sp. SC1]PTN38302.1 pyruvate carboxyltransferase [Desulfonatronum sp. SC1]
MLIDSTLREGAQMFGVYFSDALRRDILSGLIQAGIDEVEIGWAGQDGLTDLLRHGRKEDPSERARLTVWSPLRLLDLDRLAAMGVQRIHFGVPVSDAHIEHRLGTDRDGLLLRLQNILRRASELGMAFVGIGLEDVSRANKDFALRVVRVVEECGGGRIRLSDTVGLLTPLETAELVRWFTDRTELAVGFHGHDDFGMATANAITALASGAESVDVSVLGIGERAGIAALEEVAGHLNLRRGAGYDLKQCIRLARMVAEAAQVPLARNKALVGEDLFACETGLHLQGLSKDQSLFEPYAPEKIGASRKQGLGDKIGKSAVRHAAHLEGFTLPDDKINNLIRRIRLLSRKLARPLREAEFHVLVSGSAEDHHPLTWTRSFLNRS